MHTTLNNIDILPVMPLEPKSNTTTQIMVGKKYVINVIVIVCDKEFNLRPNVCTLTNSTNGEKMRISCFVYT